MDNTIGIICEVIILIFNTLIFMQLTVLKRDTLATRMLMYIGICIILAVFFVCTYFFRLPEALASFVCVTIPTATFYWILSKYKDARFFVSFCFLDTVTYVVTFFARAIEIVWGRTAGIIGYILICVAILVFYIKGKIYFKRYRELLKNVRDGWLAMATSTFLIYVLLIVAASYPKPLIQRTEYLGVYALLCVTLSSFYVVFISSLFQKRKLADLNVKLQNEQNWHKIAYEDGLTGLKNRMAYIERINELERTIDADSVIHAIMVDIDNFKKINDILGHHTGDSTLKKAAEALNEIFAGENYEVFRIGGDEFAVIAVGVSKDTVKEKINIFKDEDFISEVGCSLSLGCSTVNAAQNNAIENAFISADRAMYEEKAKTKV